MEINENRNFLAQSSLMNSLLASQSKQLLTYPNQLGLCILKMLSPDHLHRERPEKKTDSKCTTISKMQSARFENLSLQLTSHLNTSLTQGEIQRHLQLFTTQMSSICFIEWNFERLSKQSHCSNQG